MINADSHASSAEAIAQALVRELETLTQVVETLDIEHEALLGSDAERLEQAVAAKQRAIAAHAQARHERETLGLRENLRAQIESHPELFNGLKAQALDTVDVLREKGAASKNANQRNGMLIAGLRERTRSALTLLRPDAANVTLYGNRGSAEDTMGSRLLGSA
jgi:flagellar biosynthesis/type III secretory pathway chaperone